jgi:hypothetical protein
MLWEHSVIGQHHIDQRAFAPAFVSKQSDNAVFDGPAVGIIRVDTRFSGLDPVRESFWNKIRARVQKQKLAVLVISFTTTTTMSNEARFPVLDRTPFPDNRNILSAGSYETA